MSGRLTVCFIIMVASVVGCASTPKTPTVPLLLDRWQKALAPAQDCSFTDDAVMQVVQGSHEDWTVVQERCVRSAEGRVRYDASIYGKLPSADAPRDEKTVQLRTYCFDGTTAINYFSAIDPKVRRRVARAYALPATVESTGTARAAAFGGFLDGYTNGYGKPLHQRLTVVGLTLEPSKQNVNGVDCFVLSSDTTKGRYHVCMDPKHDYNVALYEYASGIEGYPRHNYSGGADLAQSDLHARVERFEKVQGHWLAAESVVIYHNRYVDGSEMTMRITTQRSQMTIHPRVDASTFVLAIPDGTLGPADGSGRLTEWRLGQLGPKGRPATTQASAR